MCFEVRPLHEFRATKCTLILLQTINSYVGHTCEKETLGTSKRTLENARKSLVKRKKITKTKQEERMDTKVSLLLHVSPWIKN